VALPTKRDEAYRLAYRKACGEFGTIEPASAAEACGAAFAGDRFRLVFLGDECEVVWPSGEVMPPPGVEPDLTKDILLLHYLSARPRRTPSGRWVGVAQVPDCRVYAPVFKARVERPLAFFAGGNLDLFARVMDGIGASRASYGDASYVVRALPRVPLLYTLWAGDDEFGPRAQVLFDETAPEYLCAEDLVVLAEKCTWMLRKRQHAGSAL